MPVSGSESARRTTAFPLEIRNPFPSSLRPVPSPFLQHERHFHFISFLTLSLSLSSAWGSVNKSSRPPPATWPPFTLKPLSPRPRRPHSPLCSHTTRMTREEHLGIIEVEHFEATIRKHSHTRQKAVDCESTAFCRTFHLQLEEQLCFLPSSKFQQPHFPALWPQLRSRGRPPTISFTPVNLLYMPPFPTDPRCFMGRNDPNDPPEDRTTEQSLLLLGPSREMSLHF